MNDNLDQRARDFWESLSDAERDDLRAGTVDRSMNARIADALGVGVAVESPEGSEGEVTVLPDPLRRVMEGA